MEEQDGKCGKQAVQRGMGYLSRAVATKWAPRMVGSWYMQVAPSKDTFPKHYPGRYGAGLQVRLALTWAARKGKPGLR